MALGNVRRDRYRRTANLGDETESLTGRSMTPDLVGLNDEPNAELPDMQIPITTNHEEWEE